MFIAIISHSANPKKVKNEQNVVHTAKLNRLDAESKERENKQSFLIGRGVFLSPAQKYLPKTTSQLLPAPAEIHSQMAAFKATLPKLSICFLLEEHSCLCE